MSRRDERDVIYLEREGGSLVRPLLIGLALGAVLGVLFAPRAGQETRRDLIRRLRTLRARTGEALEDFQGRFREEESEAPAPRRTPGDHPVAARAAGSGGGSARDELERRLAEVRARRRAGAGGVQDPDDEEPVA